ncbi:glycosyltransferase family 4 protein [Ferruginibacter sp. SUN002]|uniref:glycosyltransferase family 4 protein n=1 Tax=Ferruginibacter sp. SUN002 TaxID=2937789 RepID=UPI003D367994
MIQFSGKQTMLPKILFINAASYVYGKEKMAFAVTDGLIKKGYTVHTAICGWNDGKYKAMLETIGAKSTEIKLGWYYLNKIKWSLDSLINAPLAVIKYYKLLKRLKPDVIISVSYREVFLLKFFIRKIPVILGVHDNVISKQDRFFIGRLKKSITVYTPCSNYIGNQLKEIGIQSNRIKVIQNGIDFNQSASNMSTAVNSNTIGIVGQIQRHKGHHILIQALSQIQKDNIDFQLLIFGTGNEAYIQELKRMIDLYQLNTKVQWMGYEENKDKIYNSISFSVVPTIRPEPFGLVAVEPAIYYKPVIASDNGGLTEIVVNNVTGLIFKTNNYLSLSDSLKLLLQDEPFVLRLGKEANQQYKVKFNSNRMIEEYHEVIQSVTSEKSISKN